MIFRIIVASIKKLGFAFPAFGICLTLLAISMVPILFGVAVWRNVEEGDSLGTAMVRTFKPTDRWGPMDPEIHREYKAFCEAKKLEDEYSKPFWSKIFNRKDKSETVKPAYGVENPRCCV